MPAARPASAAPALGGSSQLPPALRGFPSPAAFESAIRPHSAPQALLQRTQGASGSPKCQVFGCYCATLECVPHYCMAR